MKFIVTIRISEYESTEEPFFVRATVEAEDRYIAAEKVLNDTKKIYKYKIPREILGKGG